MRIIVYEKETDRIAKLIRTATIMQYRKLDIPTCSNYEDYIAKLQSEAPDAVFVAISGANGMEAAITARDLYPKTALVWFSDDEAFGVQSYRIDCAYFSSKPINQTLVSEAIKRCLKRMGEC